MQSSFIEANNEARETRGVSPDQAGLREGMLAGVSARTAVIT
jgi:hypothetical protein